jgi:hypothetical protein
MRDWDGLTVGRNVRPLQNRLQDRLHGRMVKLMVSLEMSLRLAGPDAVPTLAADHDPQPRDALKQRVSHKMNLAEQPLIDVDSGSRYSIEMGNAGRGEGSVSRLGGRTAGL